MSNMKIRVAYSLKIFSLASENNSYKKKHFMGRFMFPETELAYFIQRYSKTVNERLVVLCDVGNMKGKTPFCRGRRTSVVNIRIFF